MTTPSTSPASPHTPPATGSAFVWHDLMTTDPARAQAFYATLLGWTTSTMPLGAMGDYTMVSAGEHGVGGIVPLDASHGIPSHWMSYVSVADVDAACARADATGGRTAVPPTDIPGVGRFAVVEDPSGAYFSPFRGDDPEPPAPANPPMGTAAWHELMTRDTGLATTFYADLCGWTSETMAMPQGTYWLFRRGAGFAGGMMLMPPHEDARPHWLVYFAVPSADAAAATIAAEGGTVLLAPLDVQDWGRMAVALDPTGAMFGVLENKQPM